MQRESSLTTRWRADWRMTLFVVLMLPLVIGLGVWQLQRAAYKQTLMDAYFDRLGGLPQTLSTEVAPEAFQRVRISGQYESYVFLLDNQIHNSRPGYWVYAAFTVTSADSSRSWLINRGWMAAPRLRSEALVVPPPPAGVVQLVALSWPDTGMLPLFGAQALNRKTPTTVVMQQLDVAGLQRMLASELPNLQPQELRLEAGQPGVLQAAPQDIGFGVERHQGYAFQWFGLALALVLGYYFYGRSSLSGGSAATEEAAAMNTGDT